MKCNQCGAEVDANYTFCPSCGAKIDAEPETSANGLAAGEAAAQAENAQPVQAEPTAAPQPVQPEPIAAPSTVEAEPTAAPQPVQPASSMAGRDPFAPQPAQDKPAGQPVPPTRPATAMGVIPPRPPLFEDKLAPVISVGSWLGTLLLLMLVPLALSILAGVVGSHVGAEHIVTTLLSIVAGLSSLILMFIWAFSKRVNPSKSNFFRAALILTLAMLIIAVVLAVLFATLFSGLFEEMTGNGLGELLRQYQLG